MLEFFYNLLLVFSGIFLFYLFIFLELLLFGSSVDPDDNGILRTKKGKEKYRQRKLKRFE